MMLTDFTLLTFDMLLSCLFVYVCLVKRGTRLLCLWSQVLKRDHICLLYEVLRVKAHQLLKCFDHKKLIRYFLMYNWNRNTWWEKGVSNIHRISRVFLFTEQEQ